MYKKSLKIYKVANKGIITENLQNMNHAKRMLKI